MRQGRRNAEGQYLFLREGTWYYRRVVPGSFLSVRKSLCTPDKKEAIILAGLLTFETEVVFRQMKGVPYIEIKKKLQKVYDAMLDRYRQEMQQDGPLSEERLQLIRNNDIELGDDFEREEALKLAVNADISPMDEYTLQVIKGERGVLISSLIQSIERLNNKIKGYNPEGFERDFPDRDKTLSDLIDSYVREKRVSKAWNLKTEEENISVYNTLKKLVGVDRPCSEITSDVARQFKEDCLALPVKRGTKQAVKQGANQKVETLNIRTVNKYLERISPLFSYGAKHGFVKRNVFEGLAIKQKKRPHELRDAFTREDLNVIKSSIPALSECQKEYYFWLPLFGMYTGMRLNEICQLYLDDIQKVDGIWCIDVNDSREDQRLKNPSSARIIPVHKSLIESGLMEYIDRLKIKGKQRLFFELQKGRDGYGKNPSRWFNERWKRQIGFHDKKKVFHSFRHTFSTEMKRSNIPEGHAKALLGHSENSITFGHYGKEYEIATLHESLHNSITF